MPRVPMPRARVHPAPNPTVPVPPAPVPLGGAGGAAPMDVDGGDEMAGSAGDPDAETPEGDGGSEHEGRDEADADALDDDDDEPAIRLGPLPGSAEQLKAVTAFTRAAYLRRSGSMEVRPLSKANCEKEGSAFAPFAYVFSLPPPEKLNRLQWFVPSLERTTIHMRARLPPAPCRDPPHSLGVSPTHRVPPACHAPTDACS